MNHERDNYKVAGRFIGLSIIFSAALLGLALTDSGSIQFFYFFVMAVLLPLLLGLDKKGKPAQASQESVR